MITNPVRSVPAAQNETTPAAPRPRPKPQQASLPRDIATISPQAQARFQAQAHAPQAAVATSDKNIKK